MGYSVDLIRVESYNEALWNELQCRMGTIGRYLGRSNLSNSILVLGSALVIEGLRGTLVLP